MEALGGHPIPLAFVFGSVANRSETSESDIDLMVVDSISRRALVARLAGVAEKVGRELNPSVTTESEFSKRRRTGDHFVSTVTAAPKLFVIGADKVLEASNQKTQTEGERGMLIP